MYRINKSSNNVEKLDQRLFKELHIKEREHLQEWIAKNPEMLGEDLLIIQKEFDGFNDTQERLDLLALDKDGGLVIIENKLDDTGRNVVWQALKYASYCSTLTTSQIFKMYQEYINKCGKVENAKDSILEFLERNDDDLLLNRNDQRIIFVANNYRKEVTSTVLWLLNHDVKIQCFKATPYSMGDEVFLQVEQIIPLPETKEFMIDAKEKEKEEKDKSKTVEETEAKLIKFWGQMKIRLQSRHIDFLERTSAQAYFSAGFWKGNAKFSFCIGRTAFRIELYFSNDPTKVYIEKMATYLDEIKNTFDGEIVLERLDGKKASRMKHEMPVELQQSLNCNLADESSWDGLIDWYIDAMQKFYKSTYPVLEKVQKQIL